MFFSRLMAGVILVLVLWAPFVAYAQTETPTPSPTPTPTATPVTTNEALIPIGTLILWAGNSTPTGWLVADGSCVSRTTYEDLFDTLSTTFGVCDGSTTFGIPDFRGRVPVGAGAGTGLTARSLGQQFGSETHMLSTVQLPTHAHTLSSSTGVALRLANGATGNVSGLTATSITVNAGNFQPLMTGNEGGGQAFNIVQPSLAINFLIWTGTEALEIGGGGVNPTNTPDPIRFEATVEVDGTPQAVAFYNSATVGDFTTSILLMVIILLQGVNLLFQIRDRRP
ncbi:MAG: hypothetical protein F9K46_10850 [Anaerolineae bacterium]|nr:MAG: hypothetical protein F9K46_10850 [Anaerolineae bacterium]MBZ0282086.1 tail fiber protein [Anaerolineae bacterium]